MVSRALSAEYWSLADLSTGLDATAFLRFLRLLRNVFSIVSIMGIALLVVNIVYNKTHDDGSKNTMAILTIQYVQGSWMWPALGVSYIISQPLHLLSVSRIVC